MKASKFPDARDRRSSCSKAKTECRWPRFAESVEKVRRPIRLEEKVWWATARRDAPAEACPEREARRFRNARTTDSRSSSGNSSDLRSATVTASCVGVSVTVAGEACDRFCIERPLLRRTAVRPLSALRDGASAYGAAPATGAPITSCRALVPRICAVDRHEEPMLQYLCFAAKVGCREGAKSFNRVLGLERRFW